MDEIRIGIAGSGIMGLENMGSVDAMAGTRIAVVADQPGRLAMPPRESPLVCLRPTCQRCCDRAR